MKEKAKHAIIVSTGCVGERTKSYGIIHVAASHPRMVVESVGFAKCTARDIDHHLLVCSPVCPRLPRP